MYNADTGDTKIDKKKLVLSILSEREQKGFKYGEVMKFMKKTAEDTDTPLSQVKQLYYTQVKGKEIEDNETECENSTQESSINNVDVHTVNNHKIRLVTDDCKQYIVIKDIFEALALDRTSSLAKESTKDFKQYILLSTTYGNVNTAVIDRHELKSFVEFLSSRVNDNIIKHNLKTFFAGVNSIKSIEKSKQNKINEETDEIKKLKVIEETYTTQSEETLDTRKPADIYRYNKEIDVEITFLAHYGAMVKTLDEFGTKGLINIKNIKQGYITQDDIPLYFQVGDKIKAHVLNYDRNNNRLSLSTRKQNLVKKEIEPTTDVELDKNKTNENKTNENNLNTTFYQSDLAVKLNQIKDEIDYNEISATEQIGDGAEEVTQFAAPVENQVEAIPYKSNVIEMKKVEAETVTNKGENLVIETNKEIENILSLMNSKVGALSPEAQKYLVELLNQNGIVDTTIALVNALSDFKADLGLILLKQAESKIGEYL